MHANRHMSGWVYTMFWTLTIKFYIEQQYYGYCQYLREYLDDVDKEWVEIAVKNGYIEADNDKKPWYKGL